MHKLLVALAALLATPLAAQTAPSVSYPAAVAGPSAPANQVATYEAMGTDAAAAGGGTTVNGGTTANSYPAGYNTLGTTANAWCGFWITTVQSSNGGGRFMVDIRAAGTNTIVNSLLVTPSSATSAPSAIYVPVKVASGVALDARARGSAANLTLRMSLTGVIDSTTCPPGYSSLAPITTLDTTNTRVSTTAIPGTNAYTDFGTTSAAASAFYVVTSIGATVPATTQTVAMSIGTGTGGASGEIARFNVITSGGAPYTAPQVSMLFNRAIPNGTVVSARVAAATTTDSLAVALYGLLP